MRCGIVIVMFLFRTHTKLHPLLNCSPMLKHVPAHHFLVECWTWPLRAAIDHVCFLQFPSSAWVHFARISLADEHRLCNSLLYASHSTHVPSLYSRRMYANALRWRGERSGSPFSGMVGGSVANSEAMRGDLRPQLPDCPSRGLVLTSHTRRHAHVHTLPSFCSPTQSKFVYCNFWWMICYNWLRWWRSVPMRSRVCLWRLDPLSNALPAIKKSKCHSQASEMKICMNLLAWSQQL